MSTCIWNAYGVLVPEFKTRPNSAEPGRNEISLSPETVLSICSVIPTPFRVSCFSQLLWCVSFHFISLFSTSLPVTSALPLQLLHICFIWNLPQFYQQHPVMASLATPRLPCLSLPNLSPLSHQLHIPCLSDYVLFKVWFLKKKQHNMPDSLSCATRYKWLLNT